MHESAQLIGSSEAAPRSQERLHSGWIDGVRIALLAIAFAAPLAFGAVETWAWTALLVLGLLLIVAWAIDCARQSTLRFLWSPLYLPGVLFLLYGVVQHRANLTAYPAATRDALLSFTSALIYLFLAGQLIAPDPRRNLRRWAGMTAIYGSLMGFYAIVQFFSSGGLIYWFVQPRWGGWVFGPYVNHNHYAGLMEMLIPVGAAYALSRPKHHIARVPLGIAMVVPVLSLLLSGSRGGVAALLVELLILTALAIWTARGPRRRSLATTLGLGLISVAVLFFALAPGEISRRLQQIASLSQSPDVSLAQRLQVGKDSLQILRAHPLLGTGLGSFIAVDPQFCSFPTDLHWDHAHNDYAEALAETGLVGGVLILWATILGFKLAFGSLRARLAHSTGWIQVGAAIGCCGLLVHGLADFNFHIPANALWFAICLAAATSPSPASAEPAHRPPALRE